MFCVIVNNNAAALYKAGRKVAELSATIKKGAYYYDPEHEVVFYDFMGHFAPPKTGDVFPKFEKTVLLDGRYPIIYNYSKISNSYRGDDGMELGESSRSHTIGGVSTEFELLDGHHVRVVGGFASIEGNVSPAPNWLKNICSQF